MICIGLGRLDKHILKEEDSSATYFLGIAVLKGRRLVHIEFYFYFFACSLSEFDQVGKDFIDSRLQ